MENFLFNMHHVLVGSIYSSEERNVFCQLSESAGHSRIESISFLGLFFFIINWLAFATDHSLQPDSTSSIAVLDSTEPVSSTLKYHPVLLVSWTQKGSLGWLNFLASFQQGCLGCVTCTMTSPILKISPINILSSSKPDTVKFSPKAPLAGVGKWILFLNRIPVRCPQ